MRTLVIGDIHEPSSHPGYLAFCRDLQERHKCNSVVFIGDVVDHHSISFHARHPGLPAPKQEYELALTQVAKWYAAFPKAKVCIGNHDERVIRLAASVNITAVYLRDYASVWGTPGWDWQHECVLDDIYFFHGTGNGGVHPAYNAMRKMLMSVVMGHVHTAAGVKWAVNPQRRIFGLDVGAGVDERSLAFAYGRHLKQRACISAAVILDGVPHHEICPIGPGEKYHRSRFRRKAA